MGSGNLEACSARHSKALDEPSHQLALDVKSLFSLHGRQDSLEPIMLTSRTFNMRDPFIPQSKSTDLFRLL